MASRLVLCMIKKFLNYETISYLVCGGIVTIVGFGSFVLLVSADFGTAASNSISTVIAVVCAYFLNKIFVFKSTRWGFKFIAEEFAKFCSVRFVVFVSETLLLVLLVDVIGFDPTIMKAFTMFLVVVGNYCFSKWVVFNREQQK